MDKVVLVLPTAGPHHRLKDPRGQLAVRGEVVPLENGVTEVILLGRRLVGRGEEEGDSVDLTLLEIWSACGQRLILLGKEGTVRLGNFLHQYRLIAVLAGLGEHAPEDGV